MKRVLFRIFVVMLIIFCFSPYFAFADEDYIYRATYYEMTLPGNWIMESREYGAAFYKDEIGSINGGYIRVLDYLDTTFGQDEIKGFYEAIIDSCKVEAVDNKEYHEEIIVDSNPALYIVHSELIEGYICNEYEFYLVIEGKVIYASYMNPLASDSECEATAKSLFYSIHRLKAQGDLIEEKEMAFAETKTFHEGKYIIGEDLRAGFYTIECVEASELYSSYKGMMDGLAKVSGDLGGIFTFYGSLADKPKVSVRVLGVFGEEISKFELETGDSKDFTISNGETLEIKGNKCTCKLIGKVLPGEVSKVSWGMSKEEIVKLMGCKADRESTDHNVGLKMSYIDQSIGTYKGWLTFFLKDNKMFSKNYSWNNVDESRTEGLISFMNSHYGEPDLDEAEMMAFFQTLNANQFSDDEKAAILFMLRNMDKYGQGMKLLHWKDSDTMAYLLCRQISQKESETALYFFPLSEMKDVINKARSEICGLEESVNALSNVVEETESEIRFRGIPWGSNYSTVKKEFPGSFIMDTSSALYWGGIDTLNTLVPWFPEEHISYLSTEKCYSFPNPDFTAGGYTIDNIILYFANTSDSNGKITESEKLTSLYGAKYDISTNQLDYDKAAADLKKKMESVYGDVHATYKTSKNIITYPANTNFYIWKGGNNTYAVLVVAKEDKDIFLFYLWGEGDNMLKNADELIRTEKEASTTPEPYNTDSTDGL